MTNAVLEVERKYDVTAAAQVPDLAAVPGVAAVAPPVEHLLVATYFDTEDLRLRTAGTTLRHRSGGADAGWHLKTPSGRDRLELRVAGDDPAAGVPEELRALVRAQVRDRELVPVATLSTRRTVHCLLDEDGGVLVEVADDVVTGRPEAPDRDELAWREWEAELVGGDRALLDEVEQVLLAAGAEASRSSSKVGRVLGSLGAEPGDRPWWAGRPDRGVRRGTTAGDVVQAHLLEQVGVLLARDPDVRRDLPDAVHRMRVATRRLRSALRSFRPLLDREVTGPLRDELRWLAAVLGEARDAEVLHARLRELVAAEPEHLVVGPVLARIDDELGRRYADAHAAAVRELDGERYLRLLDSLDTLVTAPPFQQQAAGRATTVLPGVVRKVDRALQRSLDEARASDPGDARDLLLHEARKEAKQARYLAESVAPVFGAPARTWAKAVTRLQEALGEHQDGVVTREALQGLAARAAAAGEDAFTYGRLHALEQFVADGAVSSWPQAAKDAGRPKLRRWFLG